MERTNFNFKEKNKRNTLNLAKWTAAWVITMAIVAFGPKFIWDNDPTISLLAIIINFSIGIGMILANKRHLDGLDEMQRKIQLESMAFTLGIAVVAGLSYSMLDVVNLINYDAEISHLVILIGLTYLTGTIIGTIRYK